jgi:hypothetical protein
MPKIIATSDLHGSLPEIEPCDILIIAGDSCPVDNHQENYQRRWLEGRFRDWLLDQPAKHIVGIAGNHDFIMEKWPGVPGRLPWNYLQDKEIELEGVRIYGTPWVPNLPGWAFFGGMGSCAGRWDAIPEGIDILVSHGPPYGYSDKVTFTHVGCTRMDTELQRIKPKAFVCGHIHEGYGHYPHPDVGLGVFNVAHNNRDYRPVNAPVEISLDGVDPIFSEDWQY